MKIIIVISCYRAPGPDSGSLVYVKPYCRIAPYLVGMVLGYLLNHSKDWRLPTKVTENKIITSLWCVFIVSRKFWHYLNLSLQMIPPILSRQGFNMFQACSVLEATYYLLQVLAIFSFSVIIFLLCNRNCVFTVWKEGDRCIQTKWENCKVPLLLSEGENNDHLSLASQDLLKKSHHVVYVCTLIAVIAVISGFTCKRGERVDSALYWPFRLVCVHC